MSVVYSNCSKTLYHKRDRDGQPLCNMVILDKHLKTVDRNYAEKQGLKECSKCFNSDELISEADKDSNQRIQLERKSFFQRIRENINNIVR